MTTTTTIGAIPRAISTGIGVIPPADCTADRRRPYRRFTAEEDAYLIAHYSTETIRQIARHLGRSWGVVQQRTYWLQKHGRLDVFERHYHRPWSEADDEYLHEWWGKLRGETVARHLNRSVNACVIRAKRAMGLNGHQNIWPARVVARLFGVNDKTIVQWVKRGWLKARRAGCGAGRTRCWDVDEDSIERFIVLMGWAYDWRRMESGEYLTRLARRVARADPWLTVDEAAREADVVPATIRQWVERGHLPARHRPKCGQYGHAYVLVVRKSDVAPGRERARETAHANRSRSVRERHRRERARREERWGGRHDDGGTGAGTAGGAGPVGCVVVAGNGAGVRSGRE